MRLLDQALRGVAAAGEILVACDYDGTLAPIVNNPDEAYPDARAVAALVSLAALPRTNTAIISGRSLTVLNTLTGGPSGVELVGSHGAELGERTPDIGAVIQADLTRVEAQLEQVRAEFLGSRLETKPAGVAFHFRNVEAGQQEEAETAVRQIAADYPRLVVLEGKRVVEFVGSRSHKGSALLTVRDRCQAEMVMFIGDDVTDEDGFAALRPGDVGVKVGSGPTAAAFRVEDQSQVASLLKSLLARRQNRRDFGCPGGL